MDERSLFTTQLEALDRKLSWVNHVLFETGQVDKALYERLSVRFAQLIEEQQRKLHALRAEVARAAVKLEKGWERLEDISRDCTNLCEESLAFLGGLLVRKYGLDHQTCLIAESLCTYWCDKSLVDPHLLVVPATEDSFTGLTNIIRVRFPDFSIWSLPIVAHEFGHYLQKQRREQVFRELFLKIAASEAQVEIATPEGQAALTDKEDSILQEQFADLFAVYVLGPAWACTCILQEFDPRTADRDRVGHPSDARRVYFLLQALEKMQEQADTGDYSWIISQLNKAWEGGIGATRSRPLTDEEHQQLDNRLDRLYEVLDDPARQLKGAYYKPTRLGQLRPLADELQAVAKAGVDGGEQQIVDRARNLLKGQKGAAVLPDLLNAAWLCRLLYDRLDPYVISRETLSVCRSVLDSQ